jgi:hypothetical protein
MAARARQFKSVAVQFELAELEDSGSQTFFLALQYRQSDLSVSSYLIYFKRVVAV